MQSLARGFEPKHDHNQKLTYAFTFLGTCLGARPGENSYKLLATSVHLAANSLEQHSLVQLDDDIRSASLPPTPHEAQLARDIASLQQHA